MRVKLVVVLVGSGLALALAATAAALAAAPPVRGGHYRGTDDSKTFFATNQTVTLVVTKDRADFASGRLNFVLKGQAGLGSCAGQAYVTLTPSRARQITPRGTFALRGHFAFKVPTRHGPQGYRAAAAISGAFSDHGKKVSGTLRETASGKRLTCHTGTVHFNAALVP